jgi:hypothetical protein
MPSQNAVTSSLVMMIRFTSSLLLVGWVFHSLYKLPATRMLPNPLAQSIVHYAALAIVAHDRLIAPRRLSRKWRNAWNPQKTKNPCIASETRICAVAHGRRTMYIKTAPNTAPATAPPSLGSSSEPMTRLLLPCHVVSSYSVVTSSA